MNGQPFSERHKSGLASGPYGLESLSKILSIAKEITQLKKTGENFSIWERELKFMIYNLSGSTDYFLDELHKHDSKLNQSVLNLIIWSIDNELRKDLNFYGSAGDAFQILASRFQSDPSARCIINHADFPEEILDNIVNMVYYQSSKEHKSIKERKLERVGYYPKPGLTFEVYLGHSGPPVLNTIQNLAVVNRKFYRLCLPKLWQKIAFPTSLPAPVSLWTDDLLLKHANSVKSAHFELEDSDGDSDGPSDHDIDYDSYEDSDEDSDQLSETGRSLFDNTSPVKDGEYIYPIGLSNIVKIFKVCPFLESVSVLLPSSDEYRSFSAFAMRLKRPLQLLPQLQHLKLKDLGCGGHSSNFIIFIIKKLPSLVSLELFNFKFVQKESEEESLGWNLARLQKLRKLSLHSITCADHTWTSNSKSWAEPLTHLELDNCEGLTPEIMHKLLSGKTPFLTKLHIEFHELGCEYDHVNVRFDLPALKILSLRLYESPDLIVGFENCKSIEIIEYQGDVYGLQWDAIEDHLSRRTWPKLLIFEFHCSTFWDDNTQQIPNEEIEEKLKVFNIKVLVNKR